MLVTARLSKRLYDQLGEELANDLVELFNQVDSTSRSELRELNEINFARFDAKLEQRAAELDAKIDKRAAELDAKIDKRTAELDAKIGKRTAELEAKIDSTAARLDARIDAVETSLTARIDAVETRLNGRIDRFEAGVIARFETLVTKAELEKRIGELIVHIEGRFTSQTRFLYLAMAMQLTATLSLWLR